MATTAAALAFPVTLLRSCHALRAYPATADIISFRFANRRQSPLIPVSRHPRYVRHISASISNEEASAKAAAATAETKGPTIFDKIISKEIPSTIVYEDDKVLAFRDISPQAPVHVIVIPKVRDGLTQLGKIVILFNSSRIGEAEARHGEILGHLLYATKLVAEKEGIQDGFRVVINNGAEACQSVYHLHLHVLGGRQMKWPPG